MIINENFRLYPIEKSGSVTTPEQLKGVASIPAEVPGNVELDLAKAGLLPEDLLRGDNVRLAEKFEKYDWWYETTFKTPRHERNMILRFEGVDCICTYWLNGQCIGTTDNSLVEHEFDVTDYLLPEGEENILHMHITSAFLAAWRMDYDLYDVDAGWSNHYASSVKIRKPPHCWGWDIMPRAISAGIWRNIYLYEKDIIAIKQLKYYTEVFNNNETYLRFAWQLDIPEELADSQIYVEIKGKCKNSEFRMYEKAKFVMGTGRAFVREPMLWWPYGYGDANIYDTEFSVILDGAVVSSKKINVGIRTVKLRDSITTNGVEGEFCFVVNDVPIMCHGTNWVPLDVYHSRDAKRYEQALALVKDIGCNIVRCWGGNVYEDEYFYDFCDKNGIMVWQDFSMACAAYSQTDDVYKAIEREAEKVIRRLRVHPCIILWAGDNECDQMLYYHGLNPADNRLTRDILPRVIYRNDAERLYLPSSPYMHDGKINPGDGWAEDHLWGARDYYKSNYYSESKAHFVSESGYHGCPSPESVKKIVDDEHIWPYTDNEQWTLHSSDQQNNPARVQLMADQIAQLFGDIPDTLEEFSFASQISQAEADKYFIERVRCAKPNKTGIIWWNLLDGWPQMSDAVVDYFFEKKIAYDYIKRSQAPFSVMIDEMKDWNYTVVAVNDTLKEMCGSFRVFDIETEELLSEGTFNVEKNGREALSKIRMMYSKQAFLVIEWNIDGKKYYNHYLAGMPGFDLEKYRQWLVKFNELVK